VRAHGHCVLVGSEVGVRQRAQEGEGGGCRGGQRVGQGRVGEQAAEDVGDGLWFLFLEAV
jgi:hypothetical protein